MLRLLSLVLLLGCGSAGGFKSDAGPNDRGSNDSDAGNNGGGDFEERVIDDTIVHGQGAAIVDIDGDGDNDVVVALSLTDAVHLYRNEGGAVRWSKVEIARRDTIVAVDVAVADFDGDGDLDVAAIGLFDREGGPGEITWYENPAPAITAWTEHPITGNTFDGPLSLAAADLNGDDRADLIVGANEPGRGVWWLKNNGGAFDPPAAIDPDLSDARSVEAADIDGDGAIDVVAAGRVSGEIAWYRNAGATFEKNVIASVPNPSSVAIANLDDDAELEVVAAVAGKLAWFDPPSWNASDIADFPTADTSRVAFGDFDGDGAIDVAAGTNQNGGELRIFFRDGAGFASQVVRAGYPGLNYVIAGDVDGDGKQDLLTTTYAHTDSSDVISWWANGR